INTLFAPFDFNCVCCCQERWLSLDTRCGSRKQGSIPHQFPIFLYISAPVISNYWYLKVKFLEPEH
ncbi:MAG: hypothetical protein AB2705_19990, partial [Candidatus Thiodiazotropha sp.]